MFGTPPTSRVCCNYLGGGIKIEFKLNVDSLIKYYHAAETDKFNPVVLKLFYPTPPFRFQ